MPGEAGEPTVTTLVWFYFFPREAVGASSTRHSPRPHLFWAKHSCITRALRAAGMRSHELNVIASASEAIHLTEERKNGLLRRDRSLQRRRKRPPDAGECSHVMGYRRVLTVACNSGIAVQIVIANASEAIHLTEERKNGLLRRDRSSQRRRNDRPTLANAHM